MTEQLNHAAQAWQTFILYTTWQSSLVALVVLTIVWSIRRMPSPLRYGLLVVVLIKFAMPPMFAAPTGIFSAMHIPQVSPPSELKPAIADDVSTLTSPISQDAPGFSPELFPDAETSFPQSPGTRFPGASGVSGVSGVGGEVSFKTKPSPPGLTLAAYLMLTHIAGSVIILFWLTLAMLRLTRTVARANRITQSKTLELFAVTAAQLKLRRRIRLLATDDPVTPMAFGVFRPTVLLPRTLLDARESQLRTILAHELAHHRRYDLLINYVQLFMLAAWWFNPLIWLLNRALRAAREDCCDDLLLGQNLTTQQTYSDTLLRAAAELPMGPAIGSSLDFAEKLHPLAHRLKRIMDSTRPRPVKLSLIGFIVVMIVACTLLPGVGAQTSEVQPEKPKPVQTSKTAVVPISAAIDSREEDDDDPAKVVILSSNLDFNPTHWAGGDMAASVFTVDHAKGLARVTIGEANKAKAFVSYYDMPIDAEKYPLLVLRYRAVDLSPTAKRTILWMDDGTGPNSGGASIFDHPKLIIDGKEHELRADLRKITFKGHVGPNGPIKGMCFYIESGEKTPAIFELIDMRFVAEQAGPKIKLAAPLTVTVVDNQGKVVPGAKVISDAQRANFARIATTDDAGRATVVPLDNEQDKHSISVEADGFVTVRHIDVVATDPIRIELHRSGVLRGMVKNEDGQPIEAAAVAGIVQQSKYVRTIKFRRRFSTWTNADGRWRSPPMPIDGEGISLRLSHSDYTNDPYFGSTGHISIDELIRGNSVAVMKHGITLAGIVLSDEDGSPVAGASVRQGQNRHGTSFPSTKTDDQGRFSMFNVKHGEVVLTIQSSKFAPKVQLLNAKPNMPSLHVVLQPAGTIRGRVIDQAGKPIAGANITADTWQSYRTVNWDSTTNAEGRFTWTGAPPDDVQFDIYKKDYMSVRNRAMKPSDQEYVITLPQPLKISGQVVDSATGQPIKQFNIVPGIQFENQPTTHWERRRIRPGTDGKYEITFTHPYPHRLLRIEAAGYRPGISRSIKSDEGTLTIDFALEIGSGGISGTVRDLDGKPVRGAKVILAMGGSGVSLRNGRELRMQNNPQMTTGEDGRYNFAEQVDPFALAAFNDHGYASVNEADLEKSPDITLQPWARVEGVYKIGAKLGVNRQMRIWMENTYEPNRSRIHHDLQVSTDDQGRFVFDRVPAGKGNVSNYFQVGRRSWGGSHSERFEVDPGQTLSVQIGGTGRPVVGRVVKPKGSRVEVSLSNGHHNIRTKVDRPKPPQWLQTFEGDLEQRKQYYEKWKDSKEGKAFVKAAEEATRKHRYYNVKVESDGSFRIEDIPAGSYTLNSQIMPQQASRTGSIQHIARLNYDFVVPPMEGGASDEPLDIGTQEMTAVANIQTGDVAPDFECKTLDGSNTIKLSDLRGKYVLLEFWATWCAPCLAETPHLKKVFEQFGSDERFVMVSLSLDIDPKAPDAYTKKQKLNWTQGFLGEMTKTTLPEQYGVMGFPAILLIGPDGKVIAANLQGPKIRDQVEQALKTPATKERGAAIGAGVGAAIGMAKPKQEHQPVVEPLRVLCVDEQGAPVAKVQVYLFNQVSAKMGDAGTTSMHGPVMADAQGIATFTQLPREYAREMFVARQVYARVPGKWAGIARSIHAPSLPIPPPAHPIRVQLHKALKVAGVVSVPAGVDPAMVTVRLMNMMTRMGGSRGHASFIRIGADGRALWPQIFETKADKAGRFTLSDLPSAAMVYLAAEGPGLGQAQLMTDDPQKLAAIKFDLALEGVIQGRVTYKPTGKPAAGISIVAEPQDGIVVREPYETTTDADGRYRITGLADGAYNMTLPRLLKRDQWTMAIKGMVPVRAGQTLADLDLQFERGALVSGAVRDAKSSKPIAGVHISALNGIEHRTSNVGSAKSDAQGRYSIRLPAGKSQLYLGGMPTGYAYPRDQGRKNLDIGADETKRDDVDFTLEPQAKPPVMPVMAKVRGRVFGEDGQPRKGVLVQSDLEWTDDDPQGFGSPTDRAHTDDQGKYELKVYVGRTYKIIAGGGEYSTARSDKIIIKRKEDIDNVQDLRIRRGTATIEGIVVDPQGKPIVGVQINASSPNKSGGWMPPFPKTDRAGRFRIDYLLADELLAVRVDKGGYENRNWNDVAPNTMGLRFVLHPLEGEVFHQGAKSIHKAKTMIGKPAPPLDVEKWVQPLPKDMDGKRTVLIYGWSAAEWSTTDWSKLKQLEQTCKQHNAVPVLIFSSTTHESGIRTQLKAHGLTLSVGIDRWVPHSEYRLPYATMIAYGHMKMPMVFVIDPGGVIRHVQSGVEQIETALTDPR